ncbi:RMD1 family protein [Gilvimarinus sp. SDUM040013]|uniref:RMD1 family protein n=1 Tax=Gilvimarinus gilvus TaxID=3058038 RepID=A0ABU4S1C8_9GAMM|nr:RMD1 family protein [Gilvimarinus sp. SDUM040013]MDO3388069.1 RMD1 family protein [Gilvimarinus sp. SDUM040013]MDX6850977.1 RMD1 family protein [Gilvimarinus sp. SDUM040013]
MNTINTACAIKRITIANIAQAINADSLNEYLVDQRGATRYRDAYCMRMNSGEAWLFDYGVLIGWNLSEEERQQLCVDLQPMLIDKYQRPLIEQYSFSFSAEQVFNIHHDMLELPEDNQMIRLALSHAFAQSAKLGAFEDKAQDVIHNNAYISKELAATGKLPLNRKQLAKLRGVLFDTSSDIALHYNLLDTPEFFWDYPELEEYYQRLAKYLDLAPRVSILNKKLETIQNLLEMLATEHNHKHSAFLEIVIIVLIAVDIVIYFFEP